MLSRKATLSAEMGGKSLFYPTQSGWHCLGVRLFDYRELKFIKMEWPTLTSWRHFFPRMWASQCKASQCKASQCKASQCKASQCKASQCKASQCKASQCQASQCKASQCKVRTHRRSEDATHFLTYPIDATLSEGERNREIFAVLGCYAE